jgi:peptide/nickel transport system permease protein
MAITLPAQRAAVWRDEAVYAPLPTLARRRASLTVGGKVGATILVLLVLTALVGPWLVDADPAKQALRGRLAPPLLFGGDSTHLLGTDQLGRDLLARLVAGARASLVIGVAATVIAAVAGVFLGLLAGYVGGRTDRVVTFFADAQLAMPFVIVAIGVVAVLGNSTRNVILVLAITGWVGYTRVIRLQAASLRNAPFVEAARASGATRWRVMGRHIMPNVAGPIIVIASQQVAGMVLYEAALSYLGLGVSAETITWGGMVANGRETLLTAWWVSTVPGIAIAITILGMNLFGDALQFRLARPGQRGR